MKMVKLKDDLVLLERTPVYTNDTLVQLQHINTGLCKLFEVCGTDSLNDLLTTLNVQYRFDNQKWKLLEQHFHPISYTYKKSIKGQKKVQLYTFSCTNLPGIPKFHMQIHGLCLEINVEPNETLVINGVVDNIATNLLINPFIESLNKEMTIDTNRLEDVAFIKFMGSLSLKSYLLSNNATYFLVEFNNILKYVERTQKTLLVSTVNTFLRSDLYGKRTAIMNLVIMSHENRNKCLAYLLYDLLSNDIVANNNVSLDTEDERVIYDSFPYIIRKEFRLLMSDTIKYVTDLSSKDSMGKVSLETQICLMDVPDSVKEKGMIKYKEVKSKSDDGGTKARAYLDGLLMIPFNIFIKEPIFDKMNDLRKNLLVIYNLNIIPHLDVGLHENIASILIYMKHIKDFIYNLYDNKTIQRLIINSFLLMNVTILPDVVSDINTFIHDNHLDIERLSLVKKSKKDVVSRITSWLGSIKDDALKELFYKHFSTSSLIKNKELVSVLSIFRSMTNDVYSIRKYMIDVRHTLDTCVHSHKDAKLQIERLIGQWLNGDNKLTASVIGFEGNPGVGKTTLAKGLAKCLLDETGKSRPLSLIAIGGDSNAATLSGHSYTYVGSSWGQIVQILMDTRCMNPIIVIDEVDKISKTEQGREILGVLTHLLDPTQNTHFHDKYFSGIDLDLSKVLFILSFNDASAIDSVVLDRIHRVKFQSLTIDDKLVICKKHLLPELYDKFGLQNTFEFSDTVLKFIIKEYTLEAGVRKLKQQLFNIIGEINLEILSGREEHALPIHITIDDIQQKYFKDKRVVKTQKIHKNSEIGIINALWANEQLQGGVLPLQVSFVPSNKFLDLTLTGSLGDVMQESIKVSLTTAWNLTSSSVQKELIAKYNNTSKDEVFGLHIHCPGIGTKKDGPSATTAFTVIIYSLFNNLKIKNYVGITGETSFDCRLTEIGGLREKILHSIPAGITEFIYPKENESDFIKIMDVYKDSDLIKGIKFHCIETIPDVLDLILER
tara:strand:- start:648 stop:3653 length:3006 start_codon:yes stop_codon:yes gene_type:complete